MRRVHGPRPARLLARLPPGLLPGLLVGLCALLLGSCGDPEPRKPYDPPPLRSDQVDARAPSREPEPAPAPVAPAKPAEALLGERVEARLRAFFEVVLAGGGEAAAPFVVYRGDQERERRWKDVCDYRKPAEAAQVDSVVKRVKKLLTAGAPRFERFHSETESEGTWLVWHVVFGEGDGAKKAACACLEVQGRIAVGDIDT